MFKFSFIVTLISVFTVHAQFPFNDYPFDNSTIDLPEIFKNENEIVLLKNLHTHLETTPSGAFQYFLYHEKTLLNSDQAVERNNRVYVPFREDEQLLINKVRVILTNGKITELKASDILEEKDEERGISYQYYAVNGLEKGAILEKIFVLKQTPELRGKTVVIQETDPIVKGSFELVYPNHLQFKYKSENGLPNANFDENYQADYARLRVSFEHIPGLPDDEMYSNWNAHAQKFLYKLQSNFVSGLFHLNNYNEFAQNVYANIYAKQDKKSLKALDQFAKKIKVQTPTLQQIRAIEKLVKESVSFNRYFDRNKNIAEVFESKQANTLEILQIYAFLFEKFNLPIEFVFTSNRTQHVFDDEFETHDNLKEILIYFPNDQIYMEPLSFEFRAPLFSNTFGNQNGLFIKGKDFGNVKMGVSSIKKIELPNHLNVNNMNITIDLREDLLKPVIQSRFYFGGYSGAQLQPLKDVVPPEMYPELFRQFAENFTQGGELIKMEFENDGTEHVGLKPFGFHLIFDGAVLIQKASETYLLKLGETIGQQLEFYQDHERMLPVEIDHPNVYNRVITLLLPDGYELINTNEFNYKEVARDGDEIVGEFSVKTSMDGQTVTITNLEYYNRIHYPLSIFQDYARVINAAADFNKRVAIIKKKP